MFAAILPVEKFIEKEIIKGPVWNKRFPFLLYSRKRGGNVIARDVCRDEVAAIRFNAHA